MVTYKILARFGVTFACLSGVPFVPAAWGQRMVVPHSQTISTLDGTPVLQAGRPSARPYLGLTLYEEPPESCQSRCLVAIPRPGPVSDAFRTEFLEVPVLRLLAIEGREIESTAEFRQWMQAHSIGSEVRLRFYRRYPKPETETTITVRVGSWEDWAAPIDYARPPQQRISPESVVPGPSEPTPLETLLQNQLELNGIASAAAETRKHLIHTMENNFAPGMLSRVAYGFYRPARLAELQTSITEPLVDIVEQNKGQPLAVMRPVLREAAKNLDLSWIPGERGQLDITSPRQALRDAAVMLRRAHAHLEAAFRGIGEDARRELTSSASGLLDPARWAEPAVVRARQASMAIDYAGILAAANSIAAWDVQGNPPPPSGPPHVALPSELRDATP